MKTDNSNLTKEQLRRQKRKKEQRKAFALLAGVIFVLLAVIGAGVFGVVTYMNNKASAEAEEAAAAQEVTETVDIGLDELTEIEEPDESEPVIKTPSVSEDSISENEVEVKELTEEDKLKILDEQIERYISGMTVEQKVAGLFFVTTDQLVGKKDLKIAGSETDTALREYPVGGILLTADNFEEKEQLKNLTFNIRSMASNEIFIGVKDPGGSESPFQIKELEEVPYASQAEIGGSTDNSVAYTAGIDMGNILNEYGINTQIGPLTDIATAGSIYEKDSYGDDPENVRGMVRNMVRGLEDKEINVCPYFFPGYGDIKSDPAGTRPVSSRSREDIEEKEYPMYRDCVNSGVEFIMVSQVNYKSVVNDETPACLSNEFIDKMLREDLEFNGIVITDFLNTKSLVMHYKHADMAVMAVKAGADMLMCPGDFKKAYNGVLDAVKSGDISEERIDESLKRIYRVKYANLIDYKAATQ